MALYSWSDLVFTHISSKSQKHGILPISQQSIFVLSSLAYHGYEGVAFRDDEKPCLQADPGRANFLVLRKLERSDASYRN